MPNADGSVRHPGLDNHGMGSIFEELVRRFNEENNEEAGEHWAPRDAVRLMARLVFLPIADDIQSGTYLLYAGACGTGGMLTVAEDTLRQLAAEHGKDVSIHLYGQEINAETYAICKADLLLKGEGEAADNIVGGPAHSTLANDAFLRREVLPYTPDAWYQPASVKTGYEISFTRYFYKPQPMRTLAAIRADIRALERETEGLLGEIIGNST